MIPITIAPSPAVRATAPTDAIDELLVCHGRIRHHLALARRLVEVSPRASTEEISEAASDLARYFTVAFPLHAEDEDASLRPFLEAVSLPRGLRAVLAQMSAEHTHIQAIVDTLVPAWREIACHPVLLRTRRVRLGLTTDDLGALLEAHLDLEERVLFPAARQILDAGALTTIRKEMRARR